MRAYVVPTLNRLWNRPAARDTGYARFIHIALPVYGRCTDLFFFYYLVIFFSRLILATGPASSDFIGQQPFVARGPAWLELT